MLKMRTRTHKLQPLLLAACTVCAFTGICFCNESGAATVRPDSCTLKFTGSYRSDVKLRKPGLNYTRYNNGKPITLNEWFHLTEKLSQDLGPTRKSISDSGITVGAEDIEVTLRAYLLAVRFERHSRPHDGLDNEFHVEVGAAPKWDEPHVIVEVATGKNFCAVRKAAWGLALGDAAMEGQKITKLRIFRHPPQVLITGYLFIDGAHASAKMTPQAWAHSDGGRGISVKNQFARRVEGIWEIHPVTALVPTTP